MVDQLWEQYDPSAEEWLPIDRYQYGYDPAGNRVWKMNAVAHDLSLPLDELYEYDELARLVAARRGLLSTSPSLSLASVGFEQAWGLDGLGNFATFQEDSDGQGWDLEQERDVNAANEITAIDQAQGQTAWLAPQYDAAGNMIVGPRADAPGTAQFYVYDAWNRLAKVFADTDENGEFDEEEDDLVAEYRYDGRNRRIEKILTETAGQPGSVEYYHNHGWQVLEERFFDDEQELERVHQNVWSPRYIDSMILRDECDTTTGGLLLPARLFYLADANYNVTGLLREDPQTPGAWQVVERYVYDPYGRVTYLDADFAALAPQQSAHDNTTLYTGRTLDRESGLMHYRRRYYELLLSTFTTRDPLGYAAGDVNLYRYVGNRAIVSSDPYGLADHFGWQSRYTGRSEIKKDTLTRKVFTQAPDTRGDGAVGEIIRAIVTRKTYSVDRYQCTCEVCHTDWDFGFGMYIDPVSKRIVVQPPGWYLDHEDSYSEFVPVGASLELYSSYADAQIVLAADASVIAGFALQATRSVLFGADPDEFEAEAFIKDLPFLVGEDALADRIREYAKKNNGFVTSEAFDLAKAIKSKEYEYLCSRKCKELAE